MSLDYKSIIDNLQSDKVIELMKSLGADRYQDKETYIIFPTICHNVDSSTASMKLYYYKDNKLFFCYTSCEGMSIFKFLENYYKARGYDYDWYKDVYLVVKNCSLYSEFETVSAPYVSNKDRYEKRKAVELETYPKGILSIFTKLYPVEWLNEGITKTTMDKYDILYSIGQNKIIIPHYNIDGELVGIRGRALDEWEVENVGKYMPVKIENTWYKHPLSMNLYGLNYNKDTIKKNGICYLFESEKSVLIMDGFEMENCGVAVCGSNFNKFQLKLLIKYCQPKEIVICFDKEELPFEDKYFNKLKKIGDKYKNYCNFSFIYDKENLLEMKESPVDEGEEIFKQLLRKRVKVK